MAGGAGLECGSGVREREGANLGHADGARLDQLEDAQQARTVAPDPRAEAPSRRLAGTPVRAGPRR